MLQSKNKISLRQVLLMFIIVQFSPGVRIAARYMVKAAKQAGWVSSVLSIIPVLLIVLILNGFYSKKNTANVTLWTS